jgi:peptidoglycan/xylan/chitin deacetylase (PgdA/CDA1 family)
MKIKLLLVAMIITVVFFSSCTMDAGGDNIKLLLNKKKNDKNIIDSRPFRGGVVLTFDDQYVDSWYNINNVLDRYNWLGTFFVNRFRSLNDNNIKKLKLLRDYGHEIAGHGFNHVNAVEYVRDYGIDAYLENEIYPMKKVMAEYGFQATSFAYPFGVRNAELDVVLLREFKIIRATTYGTMEVTLQRCFYNNNNLVWGIGIDNSYGLSMEYIKSLLEFAQTEDKIVIFYAHNPVETVTGDYQTEYQRLIEICKYVKENNMKFLRISDLYEKTIQLSP